MSLRPAPRQTHVPGAPIEPPKLRPLDFKWLSTDDGPHLSLRDPLRLTEQVALVPESLAPLLGMLDGSTTIGDLPSAFQRATGVRLPERLAQQVVQALDAALFLDNDRFRRAHADAVAAYRALPYRTPALAGMTYPASPDRLQAQLDAHLLSAALDGPVTTEPLQQRAPAVGVLSPHIDYARGGAVYAATWSGVVEALRNCEAVVVFGTDHWGGPGALTLTAQRYATPWGALPRDEALTASVSDALGSGAWAEELHHVREHAIELAVVWLHWALRRAGRGGPGEPPLPAVLPVLCGGFHSYTRRARRGASRSQPDHGRQAAALDALATALQDKRTLVVSAADLAHVGPAFGDAAPLRPDDNSALAESDAGVLRAAATGQAATFLDALRAQEDRTRVCGLPPTYWALALLERLNGRPASGRALTYAQCPADEEAGSFVSIAGAYWE